jgi:hypothetical protein
VVIRCCGALKVSPKALDDATKLETVVHASGSAKQFIRYYALNEA